MKMPINLSIRLSLDVKPTNIMIKAVNAIIIVYASFWECYYVENTKQICYKDWYVKSRFSGSFSGVFLKREVEWLRG
jgi:hypothetical protein